MTLYDTINYVKQFTYTPASGNVKVARFSRNNAYLLVGKDNGEVDVMSMTLPYSTTPFATLTPNGNKIITELDVSFDNTKILVCYSNDNNFAVIDTFAGAASTRLKDNTSPATGCAWSANDDVAISSTDTRVRVYPIPAAPTAIGASNSDITAGADFTDVDIRPTTTTPIKVIASGGNNAQADSSYFTNTGGTIG